MMPRRVSVIFLVGTGSALLAIAYHAYRSGEVRAGNSFTKAYTPTRRDSTGAFHFYLALYFLGGLTLCVWGLLAMIGMALPMRWR